MGGDQAACAAAGPVAEYPLDVGAGHRADDGRPELVVGPSGLTPVFHRYYDQPDPTARPAFLPPPGTA